MVKLPNQLKRSLMLTFVFNLEHKVFISKLDVTYSYITEEIENTRAITKNLLASISYTP